MNYYLNLFTGTTWKEFQNADACVTGFREHNWKRARNIKPGDVFLCYVVGVKRWVGLLEVTGDRYRDDAEIWKEETFPVRFSVKPQIILQPENGIPMEDLEGKVSFFPEGEKYHRWSGAIRNSPTKYKHQDGEVIADFLKQAADNPVLRPVDPKKLKRSANLYKLRKKIGNIETESIVTVPSVEEEEEDVVPISEETSGLTHTEIQWRLLDLGSKMGLNVWAPKVDRGKTHNDTEIADTPRLLKDLPAQFDPVTNQTIANIDVLWLSGNAIVAAFEVEHTTSIYSGLLRMADLITMQPNLDIKLYLVAPDERFSKFKREVPRATFAGLSKPLHTVCSFLPYSELCQRLDQAKDLIQFLKPEFIDDIAKSYDPAEEFDA
ncbi:MAG: hypothetical protein IID30_11625 [Planctomycetes bacterium]|nr:hypothetical protein [Planctomycetota bacterium]